MLARVEDRILSRLLPKAEVSAYCNPGSITYVSCGCQGIWYFSKTCHLDYYCNVYGCGPCLRRGGCQ